MAFQTGIVVPLGSISIRIQLLLPNFLALVMVTSMSVASKDHGDDLKTAHLSLLNPPTIATGGFLSAMGMDKALAVEIVTA